MFLVPEMVPKQPFQRPLTNQVLFKYLKKWSGYTDSNCGPSVPKRIFVLSDAIQCRLKFLFKHLTLIVFSSIYIRIYKNQPVLYWYL